MHSLSCQLSEPAVQCCVYVDMVREVGEEVSMRIKGIHLFLLLFNVVKYKMKNEAGTSVYRNSWTSSNLFLFNFFLLFMGQ